ncbi:hypothetical protein [Breoghania sp.]|uniref:hypothetical protein n=1 Tax=Breoghania sp. TaxID=2065378 RepID=UPI00260E6512|nr:hypothetical protein [Breoghania sp.]MDJ0930876.1 hypothetical protein [Breoghania sp.]
MAQFLEIPAVIWAQVDADGGRSPRWAYRPARERRTRSAALSSSSSRVISMTNSSPLIRATQSCSLAADMQAASRFNSASLVSWPK